MGAHICFDRHIHIGNKTWTNGILSQLNLHELAELKSLKEVELWRINKLSDISFIGELTNLEIIKLQDLKHVT